MNIQTNAQGFKYVEFVSGSHNNKSQKLFIRNLAPFVNPDKSDILNFPVYNSTIYKTDKGGNVLIPSPSFVTHLFEVKSGYRGSANITSILQDGDYVFPAISGKSYHSPTGSLGETVFICFSVHYKIPVTITYNVTGRNIHREDQYKIISMDYTGTIFDITDPELQVMLAIMNTRIYADNL